MIPKKSVSSQLMTRCCSIEFAKKAASVVLALLALISWWIFSRLTVDDAFITWRYGKNLVAHGIWNYNPSSHDLTQAYTNPLYAVLGIIPAYFDFDVVLFFKLTSTVVLVGFVLWYSSITRRSWAMILLFLSVPASIVHAYAGLETFLYVFMMTALLVSLHEQKFWNSIFLTSLLFLIRPESWLLVGLVPVYFAFVKAWPSFAESGSLMELFLKVDARSFGTSFVFLSIFLAVCLLLHYYHFGNALPNTFYAKSASEFNYKIFIAVSLMALPIAATFMFKDSLVALVYISFSFAIAYSYATSHLAMNYFGRFYFHVFAPTYLFMVYHATRNCVGFYAQIVDESAVRACRVRGDDFVKLIAIALMGLFLYLGRDSSHLYSHATYYSRALESHAAIGKTLNRIHKEYGIRAYAMGDAGMAAYYSEMEALDILGLGSSRVAKSGMSNELIDDYQIDLVAFHATPEGIHTDGFNQRPIYDWTVKNGFVKLCNVHWGGDYTFLIAARVNIAEIQELCRSSKEKNSHPHTHFFGEAILAPPWTLWRQ